MVNTRVPWMEGKSLLDVCPGGLQGFRAGDHVWDYGARWNDYNTGRDLKVR